MRVLWGDQVADLTKIAQSNGYNDAILIQCLNWPAVSDIIRSETATTMCKSLNGLVPEYLPNLFERISTQNVRELRNNTETDRSIRLRKTDNGQRAVSFRGPKIGITLKLILNRHHLLPPCLKSL